MGYSTLGTGPHGESEFTKGKTTGSSGTTRGLSGETGGESCQNDRVEGTAPDKPKTTPKPRMPESHFAKYYEYYLHRSLGNKTSLGDDLKNFVKRITGQQTVDKKAEQAALAKEVLDDLMADKRDSFIRELRVRSPENLEKLKQRWAPESELDPYDFFLEYFHGGEITTCLASDYDITQPVLDQRLRDELRLALDEWRKNPLPPLEPEELEGFKETGNEEEINQNNIMQEVLGDELILRNTISNHPKTGPEGEPDFGPDPKDRKQRSKNIQPNNDFKGNFNDFMATGIGDIDVDKKLY